MNGRSDRVAVPGGFAERPGDGQLDRRGPPAIVLWGLGGISLVGYGYASFGLGGTSAVGDVASFLGLFLGLFGVYFVAIAWVARGTEGGRRRAVLPVLLFALLFRLALLPAGLDPSSWSEDLAADLRSERVGYRGFLLYDNDVWRYLWDGHATVGGFSPYRDSPAALEELADDGDPAASDLFERRPWYDVFDNLSYREVTSVYPPLAQLLFVVLRLIAPGSVLVLKLCLVLLDLGACLLLVALLGAAGRSPAWALVYAWNPLLLKEVAGSGHLEPLPILLLLATLYALERGRHRLALAAFGLAVTAKLMPVLLAPLVLRRTARRHWWVFPFTLLAASLPFLGSLPALAEGLARFAREWVFNPGFWLLVEETSHRLGAPGRGVADTVWRGLVLLLVVLIALRDDSGRGRLILGCGLILAGLVWLGPTVMPWYLLWALPFVALSLGGYGGGVRFGRSWLGLTALSLLSYLIFIDQREHRWWLVLEHGLFVLLVGVELWFLRGRSALRRGAV